MGKKGYIHQYKYRKLHFKQMEFFSDHQVRRYFPGVGYTPF